MTAARDLMEEVARRAIAVGNRPDILASAFRQQRDFILDPAKLKALFCTRRSAKSYTAGLYLVFEALRNPGCNVIFIGLTRASAKAIIWKDVLRVINHQFQLDASPNQTDLTMTLPNGSVIYVTGADADEEEMNKLLGRKFRLACIDEASMYTIDVRNLVYGVLGPAMTDPNKVGDRGTICLMGTASNFPRGLFYDVTTRREPGWELFEWTAHDNPHVAKQWAEALEEIRLNRPLYMETPQFKQWYLNQWVVDEEKLCYRFSAERNLVKAIPLLPQDGWVRCLGVDTGWEDDNAFVLTAYHVNDPSLYVLKTFNRKKLTFDQVTEVIQKFQGDSLLAPHKVFIDGANKQGVESMRVRSSIPFEYADKQDKATFIELCNADLVQAKIKIHDIPENRPLWDEMLSLVWQTDGDKIKYPKKEHPALPNHLCFVAGTPIRTPGGHVPIEDLRPGDLVLTRKGPRRIQSTITSDSDVLEVTLSNGVHIVSTPDHPFWANDTWVAARELNASHRLEGWGLRHLARSGYFGTVIFGVGTIAATIAVRTQLFVRNAAIFIARCGLSIGARSQPDTISTIKTATHPIIGYPTSIVYPPLIISRFTQVPASLNNSVSTAIWQPSGIGHLKDGPGIENMARRPSRLSKPTVPGAAPNTKSRICKKIKMAAAQQSALPQKDAHLAWTMKSVFAHIAAAASRLINIVSKTPAHLHVLSITAIQEKRKVYNISVEDQHEYFAHDVLVSNCDAFLYSWRNGYHYHSAPAEKKVIKGSREWYLQQSENIWEREKEKLVAEVEQQEGDWPADMRW